ncbi:winged helix-turn-helix domain-containing protein [Erythrobacter sp. BLCC-B19]|uniref:winged helix-turn-helix domain-containing protein n=1 Tax=Erythrobacter sp. BLCC-B19 TaxID=3025315 RepID=UPI002361A520|nr:winged helix-turn-helix domain-containing protein [Erythrobacter sp. BLCC-B19]WDA40884.1 winged helix-turn-helix domain-containing protein [Erythrobacter sp. BLCC-B19]
MDELPDTHAVASILLRYLVQVGQPRSAAEAYRALAEQFGLARATRNMRMPNQAEPHWNNRVRTAMNSLVKKGYAERSVRDEWTATKAGRERVMWLDKVNNSVKINI